MRIHSREDSILIHGLGCPKTGGKVVLGHFIQLLVTNYKCHVLLPAAARDLAGDNFRYTVVPNWLTTSGLRPLLEFFIGILYGPHVGCRTLNLSNYGLSLGGTQWLLIHSPEILDDDFKNSSISGFCKNFMMLWSLVNCDAVLLQTSHMAKSLTYYCRRQALRLPKIRYCMPELPSRTPNGIDEKNFVLFYPASPFAHKRIDLCEQAADDPRLAGCKIIVTNSNKSTPTFSGMAAMHHSQVIDQLSRSHALIFTSELETLGLPLLEALSFGLPAVLPNLPYASEIYGDGAVYFDTFSPIVVANAVINLKNNYEQYKARAMARASKLREVNRVNNKNLLGVFEAEVENVV